MWINPKYAFILWGFMASVLCIACSPRHSENSLQPNNVKGETRTMDFEKFKDTPHIGSSQKSLHPGSVKWPTLNGNPPIVIAHRGASGYLPEHTLAAYDLAIDLGADYIEPDLVITKDGQLVARHDRYLSSTTNIGDHGEFADRKTVKEGREEADWFVEDFTLAELKTLRAVQPREGRSPEFDGQFEIPTFEEILQLAQHRSLSAGRRIGVYPETKHPAALEALGLSFDDELLRLLDAYGFQNADDPVFIQSFEADNLKRLRVKTNLRQIFLTENEPDIAMDEIRRFADGIGPYKKLLIDEAGGDSGFVGRAHRADLMVHPWTFRDDDVWPLFDGDTRAEIEMFMRLGIDGLFSDFANTPVSVRAVLHKKLFYSDGEKSR